jgi:hypothetical protein
VKVFHTIEGKHADGSAGNQLGKKYFLKSGSFLGYSPGMKLTGTVA